MPFTACNHLSSPDVQLRFFEPATLNLGQGALLNAVTVVVQNLFFSQCHIGKREREFELAFVCTEKIALRAPKEGKEEEEEEECYGKESRIFGYVRKPNFLCILGSLKRHLELCIVQIARERYKSND